MAQSFRELARTRLSALTSVDSLAVAPTAPSAPPPGQLLMTDAQVKELTAELESGLLLQNADTSFDCLDKLTHILEMQIERTRDLQQPVRSVNWQSGVVRLVAARSLHAALRIPDFAGRLDHDAVVPLSLTGRLFGVLNAFTDLTSKQMAPEDGQLTPHGWLTATSDIIGIRNNLGVAYYHLSRLIQIGAYNDAATLAARDATFKANFDVMFYALTYGPLVSDSQSDAMIKMLSDHIELVENYLHQPQPSVREDPERFAVSTTHVTHILTTVDRAKATLALFSS